MDISILKEVVAQGPWAALFVGLLLYVIRESARREAKLMEFVQAQGESLAKLAGKMERICAELCDIKRELEG